MKKIFLLAVIALMGIMTACSDGNRIIERPLSGARNTQTIEIDKIILSDTATIVYIDAFYYPKKWIRFAKGTSIISGDKKYEAVRGEGISLGKNFWMPESGKGSFQLIFPPIDPKLTSIDLIEGDRESDFKVFDIDLTGKAAKRKYPAGLPKAFRPAPYNANAPLPDLVWKVDTTTLTVHFMGYRKGMAKTIELNLSTFFPNSQTEYNAAIDPETGTATFQFLQFGPGAAWLYTNPSIELFYLTPGENAEIYVDLPAIGRNISEKHYHSNSGIHYTTGYFKGHYADLYQEWQKGFDYYSIPLYKEGFATPDMTADAYTDKLFNTYYQLLDSLQQDATFSGYSRELNSIQLNGELVRGLVNMPNILLNAYRKQNDGKNDYIPPMLSKEHYARLKDIDLNTEKVIYTYSMLNLFFRLYQSGITPDIISPDTSGFLFDYAKVYQLPKFIEEGKIISPKDSAALLSVENPYYAQALAAQKIKLKADLAAAQAQEGCTLCKVPAVSNEKLFDAIAAKYKGKVVMVDFWATWCGPCRNAIKTTEPLKDKELKSDQLVFVYITDESSPKNTWLTMIGDIKGEHYRINSDQWQYLCKKFNIEGIPSYALIEKDGSYKLRNDFRNHETMKKTLLEKIK